MFFRVFFLLRPGSVYQIVVNLFQVPTARWMIFCVFLYIFHEFVIRLDNMYQVHTFLVNFVLYSYLYHVAMTFSSFAANYHRRWDRNNPTDAMAAGWRRQKRGHVNKLCLVAKKLSQKKNMKHPILHVVCVKCMYSGLFEFKTPQKSHFYYSRGKKYGYSSEL